MLIRNVLVIGGSGFLGRHVVRRLAAQGVQVRVPTRNRERAKDLILLPTVDVMKADVHDAGTLNRLNAGCQAVINLVGVLHGDFRRAHVELPRRLVTAAREAGVQHFLHTSALGANSDGPSAYLRSKAEGEAVIRAAQSDEFHTTILRPSVIFGPEDRFLNLFARLVRALPVIALAGPHARFQPVYVDDVACAMVASLGNSAAFGKVYELCGPRVYTLGELVGYVMRALGVQRPLIELGPALSMLQASLLEHLPGKLMTHDNLRSMQVDNVCKAGFPRELGIAPTPLEAVVPMYIGGVTPRSRYRWFRYRARR